MADPLAPIHRLSPAEQLYQRHHIDDDRRPAGISGLVIPCILAYIAVALRLYSRKVSEARLQADDHLIVISLIVLTGQLAGTVNGIVLGGGRHVILLRDPSAFAKTATAMEILYVAGTATVKLSILLLYRRLFGSQQTFKKVLWAIGAFVLAYSIAEFLILLFQCRPIEAAWNMAIQPEYCVNLPLAGLIIGIVNVATDIVTLMLPIRIVWSLQLERRWKIQIAGIFLSGSFVCIGSVYRCITIDKISSKDPTWDLVDVSTWAFVENAIGIVSACLPVLKPIYNIFINGHHCSGRDACDRCQRSRLIQNHRKPIFATQDQTTKKESCSLGHAQILDLPAATFDPFEFPQDLREVSEEDLEIGKAI